MTDLYLTPEHRQLRDTVRAFAELEVAPQVARMEAAPGSVERDLPDQIARLGWIGATIDADYGGMGAGHLAKTLIIEGLSRVSGAIGAAVQASQLGTAMIINHGSPEQRRTWLPAIAAGECLPTIAVTETGSGSQVLGMESTAYRSGDHYILNGRKVWVGNSHIGHLHGVVARTGSGSRGLTAFLVEADRPGLSLAPLTPAMGLRGFAFGEIVLDNCRVPVANRLGEEGDGLAAAYSSSILYGRPNLATVALGLHQAMLDSTVTFARERPRYGGVLADLPTNRQRLGRMQSRLMTARLTAYHAAHLLDRGEACDAELINAKHTNVEAALASARDAMDLHGAAGLLTDRAVERLLRDAHHTWAPAGTGDIQLHRLAEAALELPHGLWSLRYPHDGTPRQAPAIQPRPPADALAFSRDVAKP